MDLSGLINCMYKWIQFYNVSIGKGDLRGFHLGTKITKDNSEAGLIADEILGNTTDVLD